ncbi:MAG: FG-GAP-like repeat-containing protein [Candidatus Latescibacterota bacterium]|jgi:hypothetical protein
MGRAILLVGLLLFATETPAMTWEFVQEGDSQGWKALTLSSALVPMVATDGMLRVASPPMDDSSFRLLSPDLRVPSGLFDQVRVRLRVVDSAPVAATLWLVWTNALSDEEFPAGIYLADQESRRSFFVTGQCILTSQWQEVTLSDFGADVVIRDVTYRSGWEGELGRIALRLAVQEGTEVPGWLEVDRIVLTGTEEQLHGELLPPGAQISGRPGSLFEVGGAMLMTPGLAWGRGGYLASPAAVSIDWDRDGDRDLMAYWQEMQSTSKGVVASCGWTFLENDGAGLFAPRLTQSFPDCGWLVYMRAGDVDGDGREELVVQRGQEAEIWRPMVSLLPEVVGRMPKLFFLEAMGEVTGGGGVEVIGHSWHESPSAAEVWTNEDGEWVVWTRTSLTDLSSLTATDFNGDGQVEILWSSASGGTAWRVTTIDGEPALPNGALQSGADPMLLVHVDDLDMDGDLDMVEGREGEGAGSAGGLAIWQNDGQGELTRQEWYDPGVTVGGVGAVYAGDLDGDGLADLAFANESLSTGPAVVVNLGRQGELPQEEGWYPLKMGGSLRLVGTDVDGDGDTDLVVLSADPGELQVLTNQSRERGTAVAEEQDSAHPTALRLGANYPNPFNPGTRIPLTLPAGGEWVSLAVHDLLGQQVRQLVQGWRAEGPHLLTWDGCDDDGCPVAAGVYLCRAQVGRQVQVRKLVKVE